MKSRNYYFFLMIAFTAILASCSSQEFKKTKTGLDYKIIGSGNSKDSIARVDDVLKLHVITKWNDSVMYTSYDKMPAFVKVQPDSVQPYSPYEVFGKVRKGDSLI